MDDSSFSTNASTYVPLTNVYHSNVENKQLFWYINWYTWTCLLRCVAVTQHRAHTDIFILQFSVSSITWHTEIAKHTTALLCDEIDIRFENGFSNAVLTSHLKWDNNEKIVLIPNRNSHTNNRVSFTHIRYEFFCVRRLLCRQVSASISFSTTFKWASLVNY